jgi:hypothetical protein
MEFRKQYWTQIGPRFRLSIWILLIAIAILTYYLFVRVVIQNLINFPDLFFQLFITVCITLVFVEYSYHRTNELRFNDSISRLIREIITNTERLLDSSYEEQIKKIEGKAKAGDWAGFDKWPSFTNWSSDSTNFYLKYLPTTCYYSFIAQGLFESKFANKISDSTKQIIAKSYFKFSKLNIMIQLYENDNLGYNTLLPEGYRESYFEMRNQILKMYYTKDFFTETIGTINTVIESYPEINVKFEFEKLKKGTVKINV